MEGRCASRSSARCTCRREGGNTWKDYSASAACSFMSTAGLVRWGCPFGSTVRRRLLCLRSGARSCRTTVELRLRVFAFRLRDARDRPLSRSCRRFFLARHHGHVAGSLGAAHLHHPGVQQAALELPAIAQPEGRHSAFGGVAIERVRADAEVLGRLPDVHYLTQHLLNRTRHGRYAPLPQNPAKPEDTGPLPSKPAIASAFLLYCLRGGAARGSVSHGGGILRAATN